MNIPETRTVINVEDYPNIDVDTQDGREELATIAAGIAFSHGSTPMHFVFRRGGEEIGEMILKSPFKDKMQ